jgi:pimeloyl-ACP methyl ester carboxylesterase
MTDAGPARRGAADPLDHHAAAQRRDDPVVKNAEHRQRDAAAERALIDYSPSARWWEDIHVVDRDRVAMLRNGPTAYRLVGESGPLVVLLHGAFSCSYVWLDLMKRFASASAESKGQATRELIFDFYGRGLSPWPKSNPRCTVELLVAQLEELLAFLGLAGEPLVLVGHDMGCVVGAAFAARNWQNVRGLVALGPAGTARPPLHVERLLLGVDDQQHVERLLLGVDDLQLGALLERLHQDDFFDQRPESSHYSFMRLHVSMVGWQIANTPGYAFSLRFSRAFPLVPPLGTCPFIPRRHCRLLNGCPLLADT